MATFRYKATDKRGRLVSDTVVASSKKEAETLLRDKELKVIVLEKEKKAPSLKIGRGKFPISEKISLCRYLSVMMNAGLPLEEGFELLIEGTSNKTVREVLQDVAFSLRRGKSLFAAFSGYPSYFDSIFLAMIKTGEVSGTLERSFEYLGEQYKREEDLRRKITSALLYPAIIITLMVAVGFLMLAFVLPRLGKVFLTMNIELPAVTRVLLEVSLFLEKNLILTIVGFLVFIVLVLVVAVSKRGKKILHFLISRLPLLRNILLDYNLARFSQSLSALLKGGVAVGQALEIASQSLVLSQKDKIAKEFSEKVAKGLSLAAVFAQAKIFPPLMVRMVAVGEKTGSLDKTLIEAATFYQEEVENSLKNFITMLEPILMILVGIGVGLMVVGFISPIYSLISKLQPG